MSKVLWSPSRDLVERAQVTAFARRIEATSGRALDRPDQLHAWSVSKRAEFWEQLWTFCEVKGERQGPALVHGDDMLASRWFPGSTLNFAENLLRKRDETAALIAVREDGERQTLSFAALYDQVARAANFLRKVGIGSGDRVAAIMPNAAETVVFMLASASVGAVFSSCSPDFGAQGILDRFGQINPKLLIAVDGYIYGGKRFQVLDKLRHVLEALPTVQQMVLVPYLDPSTSATALAGSHKVETTLYEDALSSKNGEVVALEFAALPFDHPLYILYSSGTTGCPKCIVHGAGGTLLQHLKEHRLHCDLREGERLFYFTTCGWMMWNWLVTGLASNACLVLYDGSPVHPSPDRLFQLADELGIHIFGTSAKFIDALAKKGAKPIQRLGLEPLRSILSTGSPLSPESFDYVYRDIKEDVHLASISGGTDIISCFVLGNPTLPVRRGEIQGPGLGMDVCVYNPRGLRVVNELGELVCRRSFPSMPVSFFGDEDGSRYRAAYFERFDRVWCHGDYTLETDSGGFVIAGRSDATLNPGGVRIGTAEIYRAVERIDAVLESLAVGQPHAGDERVVLFVTLRQGTELDDELKARIRNELRTRASPRHVPARILAVPDLPRTRSGKISELAVKRILSGRAATNRAALANPEVLAHFKDRAELAD